MKTLHHSVPLLLFIALTIAACDNPIAPTSEEAREERTNVEGVLSKADVNHFRLRFDLPLALGIPCIPGEVALGDGVRHLLVHEVENDNGSLFRFHLNHSRITGIGTETGEEYVGQLIINEHGVSFTEEGGTETFQLHVHGVSKGSSPNWFVSMLLHLTLNADGELAAETELFRAECRG